MSFLFSPHRLSCSWLLGYYGMALNATVGGRGRSWPICYQVSGVSQGASKKLSAVTHVSKHGNFIDQSKALWNKPVPLENRRGDQMIWKVERMWQRKRENHLAKVRKAQESMRLDKVVCQGWKGREGREEKRGVKQINFQHLSSECYGYPCTGVKEPLHLFSQFKSRKHSNKDIPDEKWLSDTGDWTGHMETPGGNDEAVTKQTRLESQVGRSWVDERESGGGGGY